MKFGKVLDSSKETSRNDGLFHIIYAEESNNFILNFEDSQHSLASNPDLKIHMNRKINE